LAQQGTESEPRKGNQGWEGSPELEVGFLDSGQSWETAKLENLQRC